MQLKFLVETSKFIHSFLCQPYLHAADHCCNFNHHLVNLCPSFTPRQPFIHKSMRLFIHSSLHRTTKSKFVYTNPLPTNDNVHISAPTLSYSHPAARRFSTGCNFPVLFFCTKLPPCKALMTHVRLYLCIHVYTCVCHPRSTAIQSADVM